MSTKVPLSPYGEEEERFYGGSALCCESVTNLDVRQGNVRFWDNMESKVDDKVWEAISKLGVVDKDKVRDYSKKIVDMENSDKEIMKNWKVAKTRKS